MKKQYLSTWESIKSHPVPAWYEDCKFGIFIHWGIYSVPAYAPRAFFACEGADGIHKNLTKNTFHG